MNKSNLGTNQTFGRVSAEINGTGQNKQGCNQQNCGCLSIQNHGFCNDIIGHAMRCVGTNKDGQLAVCRFLSTRIWVCLKMIDHHH